MVALPGVVQGIRAHDRHVRTVDGDEGVLGHHGDAALKALRVVGEVLQGEVRAVVGDGGGALAGEVGGVLAVGVVQEHQRAGHGDVGVLPLGIDRSEALAQNGLVQSDVRRAGLVVLDEDAAGGLPVGVVREVLIRGGGHAVHALGLGGGGNALRGGLAGGLRGGVGAGKRAERQHQAQSQNEGEDLAEVLHVCFSFQRFVVE